MSAQVTRWFFWIAAAVGAYYLITEHRAHLLDYLPYLLLMACPLMHIFGHRGHGHSHHGRPNAQPHERHSS